VIVRKRSCSVRCTPRRSLVRRWVPSGEKPSICLVDSKCAEDSAHYNAGGARREVSCLIGQRRTGWCLLISLYHFAAAGLRAAHGRHRALRRVGNRDVRDPQSGLVRTRCGLRSETESWKIASFNRLARRTVKNKARQTHTISLGNFADYVTRHFNASSAELKSSRALDLRWNRRLTRSSDLTGVRRSEIAFQNKFRSERDSSSDRRLRTRDDCPGRLA